MTPKKAGKSMQTSLSMTETLEAFMVGEKFINYYQKATTLYPYQRKNDFLDYLSLKIFKITLTKSRL